MSEAAKKDDGQKSNSGKHGKKVSQHDVRGPRRPTDEEWESLVEDFEGLAEHKDWVWVTSEFDPTYNCLAWALGKMDEFIEEAHVVDASDDVLARGYVKTAEAGGVDGEIDLWSTDGSGLNFAHATVRYKGLRMAGMPGDLWESKDTHGFRFTHGRFDIACSNYNKVAASFKKKP